MINASGPSGVPIPPNQPSIGASPVPVTPTTTPPLAANMPATPPLSGNASATAPSSPSGSAGSSLKPPKKKLPIKMIIGGIVLILLIIGSIAGYLLTRVSQDVRQQAAGETYGVCTNSLDSICVAGIKYQCVAPGSPYESTGQPCATIAPDAKDPNLKPGDSDPAACIDELGGDSIHKNRVDACENIGGTWDNSSCDCQGVPEPGFSCTSSGQEQCVEGTQFRCDSPGLPPRATGTCETGDTARTACIAKLGNFEVYDTQSGNCVAAGNTWSDPLCKCLSTTAFCFTTQDQCATFSLANCSKSPQFSNSTSCHQALAASGNTSCTEQEIATCTQAGGICVYKTELNRGTCENVTAGDSCFSDNECQKNGGNLVCKDKRCVQPPTSGTGGGSGSTGGSSSQNQTGSSGGTGSCAACLGLGGQAERDCYAQCSGTIATGICTGMTTTQCQAACAAAGGTSQVCTGTQEAAGTPRAGEFLSCSTSGSVNGCGQFDCVSPTDSNVVLGFVIDNSQCTATGGAPAPAPVTSTTTQPKPTLSPDLAACGEGCSTDNNCADANHSCIEGVCRLTTNPTSENCTEPTGATPTPVPQPSPTPVPTTNPDLASCNQSCTQHADCADLLHSCQGGVCRLTSNPGNAECKTPTNTTPPTVPRTESTPLQCNAPCTSNSQCSTFNHICYNGTCRLSSNQDNVSCTAAVVYQSSSTQLGQINQQPDAPTVLPSSGAQDFIAWLLAGLGAVAAGAIILLLL